MAEAKQSERIKPPALKKGDTVGIVAPASHFPRPDFDAGCEALRADGIQLGFRRLHLRPRFVLRRIRRASRPRAGSDVRAPRRESHCLRPRRLRRELSAPVASTSKKIAANPKIFVGYSDLTSLLTYLCDAAGIVTFHGPMVAKDFAKPGGVDVASWQSALGGDNRWPLDFGADSGVKSLVQGSAEGVLYGGCLSMLVESLGTPYEIHTEGTILFIEDVAAKPYQIDRMLMHLKLAGKLTAVRGIIFGEMLGCTQSPAQGYTLRRSRDAGRRRFGRPGRVRRALWPRLERQYHAADRRECAC